MSLASAASNALGGDAEQVLGSIAHRATKVASNDTG
jgi:hypothetical protein